jgi:predicted transcriptional regulator
MAKRSGKSVSFDAMIKFFMIRFEIPTRQDIQKIMNRLDQLEKTIKKSAGNSKSRRTGSAPTADSPRRTVRDTSSNASEIVLKAIRESAGGLSYADISEQTHFDEKKIRNVLNRLHKTGKIQRKSRGVYVAAD